MTFFLRISEKKWKTCSAVSDLLRLCLSLLGIFGMGAGIFTHQRTPSITVSRSPPSNRCIRKVAKVTKSYETIGLRKKIEIFPTNWSVFAKVLLVSRPPPTPMNVSEKLPKWPKPMKQRGRALSKPDFSSENMIRFFKSASKPMVFCGGWNAWLKEADGGYRFHKVATWQVSRPPPMILFKLGWWAIPPHWFSGKLSSPDGCIRKVAKVTKPYKTKG